MQLSPDSPEQRVEQARVAKIVENCTRFLSFHGEMSSAETFGALAEYCAKHEAHPDRYGSGKFLHAFEAEIATLLGKEAAVFLPSGVMAQLIALRIWSDRAGSPHIAFHATSHLAKNENEAYKFLHRLEATLLGSETQPVRRGEIAALPPAVSAVLLELPYRRLGGTLHSWEELTALQAEARGRNMRLHLDGARIWESQPFYRRDLSEICAGFDSVYVSFYKGIGALTGAMLCGSQEFIAEARVWQRRHGGNLHELHPYVVSAKMNFDLRRARFGGYRDRAVSLARALATLDGVRLRPELPQTSLFHLLIQGPREKLRAAALAFAERERFWVLGTFFETPDPAISMTEISVGDQAMALSNEEIVGAITQILQDARRS